MPTSSQQEVVVRRVQVLVPAGQPSVSMTLASRAMARRQGFIWREDADPSQSQLLNRIKAGMYVPLLWKGQVLGVACVDNSDGGTLFSADDLRLMLAVAHYAAMAASQSASLPISREPLPAPTCRPVSQCSSPSSNSFPINRK